MDTFAIQRDVDVDDVAFGQRAGVGDAVADHFVDGGAHRLRVAAVVERARVATRLDAEVVDDAIDLVGGDTGPDDVAVPKEDLGRRRAGQARR